MRKLNARTKATRGFTLIELLVVISILALLMSIMMPSLNRAREIARRAVCGSNQRNIFLAMMQYAHDFKNHLHSPQNGYNWYDNHQTRTRISPDQSNAYWGVAYEQYGAAKTVFKCPAKRENNLDWTDNPISHDYHDYGLNGHIVWAMPRRAYMTTNHDNPSRDSILRFRQTSSVVLIMDHWESALEGNGDMHYIIRGKSENLTQWKTHKQNDPLRYGSSVREIWRHGGYLGVGRGSSNFVWLDGHISNISETTGEDVPYVWFHGGLIPNENR